MASLFYTKYVPIVLYEKDELLIRTSFHELKAGFTMDEQLKLYPEVSFFSLQIFITSRLLFISLYLSRTSLLSALCFLLD